MDININDLYENQRTKQINRLRFFENILKKCYHRIKTVGDKGETFCFYIVPEFSMGIPLYNVYQCSQFIIDHLIKKGFNILYIRPNLIYISWDIKQYLTQEQIQDINQIPIPQIQSADDIKKSIQLQLMNDYNLDKKKYLEQNYTNPINHNMNTNMNPNTINNNMNPNTINNMNLNTINMNSTTNIRSTKDYKPSGRIIL